MSHHRYTPVDELRSATRFVKERGTDVAVISHAGREKLLVDVHDESLGGLGVYVHDAEFFVVGREVEIIYAGQLFRARVCHVQPQADGDYIVGFACEPISTRVPKSGGGHAAAKATNQ